MIYDRVMSAADDVGLLVMGALHPDQGTLILLVAGPDFWPVFTAAPESQDGAPDPIDRWSQRVVGGLATEFGATARYPFGGPPYEPFINWSLESGRAFQSPVGMMVHDTVGMLISIRGALHFADVLPFPAPTGLNPCDTCIGRPCTTTCPVGALSADAPYDLGGCHAYLDRPAGQSCMANGCAARLACPISAGAGRVPEQSTHHMKAFHPK